MVGSGRWLPAGVVTLRDVVRDLQRELTLVSWGSLCPGTAHGAGTAGGRAPRDEPVGGGRAGAESPRVPQAAAPRRAPGAVPSCRARPARPEGGSAGAGAVGRVRAGGCGSRRLRPAAAGAGGGFLPPPGRAARAAPWSGPGSRCPGPGRRCPGSWPPQVRGARPGRVPVPLVPGRGMLRSGGGGGRAGASRRPGALRRRWGRYRLGRVRVPAGAGGGCSLSLGPARSGPGRGYRGERAAGRARRRRPRVFSVPCCGHSVPSCATSPGDSVAGKAAGLPLREPGWALGESGARRLLVTPEQCQSHRAVPTRRSSC